MQAVVLAQKKNHANRLKSLLYFQTIAGSTFSTTYKEILRKVQQMQGLLLLLQRKKN
jgi:hypothetical protein